LGSTRDIGLNLEKTVKRSKFIPPSLIKATPSESVNNRDIVSDEKIASDQDIACPVTLSKPAILCDPAIISNPAHLKEPAILCDSAKIKNGRSVRISSQNGHVNSWTSPIKL
jgi:hypothetical protein